MTTLAPPTNTVPAIPPQWRPQMRFLGAAFLLLLGALFVLSLPTRYLELTQVCTEEICPVLWLTPADAAALDEMGMSRAFYAGYQTGIEVIAVGLCAVLCLFIFYYHSHTWMGLLTAVVVLAAPIFVLNSVWTFIQANQQYAIAIEMIQDLTLIAMFGFMHVFPSGEFAPRWSRWNLLLLSGWVAITFVHIGDPTELYSRELYAFGYAILGLLGAVLLGLIFYRYRRVLNPAQKQQVKWVLLAIFIDVLGAVDWILFFELFPPEAGQARILNAMLHFPFTMATQVAIPVAITIAILRYRLWDVDVLINRTLVYTILTVLLILLYIAIVAFLNATIRASTNTLSSIVATGVVAVSFQGLRVRIQQGVNRLMFGQRDEPQAVLLELSGQLSTAVLPADLLNASVSTIARSLKIPYVAIISRRAADATVQAQVGANNTPTQAFPLIYQNEAVGELVVGQRSPGEPLSAADVVVLESVAGQLGAVVSAVRLQSELQTARERLVITREEERRRLRRDLHDGLGPALASLPLKIDAAIDLIARDPEKSVGLLGDVKRQSQALVADVRRVVNNLRPPALDELGLVEALRGAVSQLGGHPNTLRISLDADALPHGLPAATEAAAYHITMEAVNNVVKHAGASHCWVKLYIPANAYPPALQIDVEDDGVGLPMPVVPNVGLHTMRERAEELGGGFTIAPRVAGGTCITVTLPLARDVIGVNEGTTA